MTRVVVVGGGITGLTAAHALAGLLPGRRRDRGARGRRPPRRQARARRRSPACPPSTRAPTRSSPACPHATALAREVGLGDELTSPTGATAAVWYDGLHPIPDGLAARRARPTSLRLSRERAAVVAGQGCAPRSSRCCPGRDADDSIGALVRAPVRRRGPRAARRRPRRQHLRRRHRPLQPGDGAAARRARRRRPQPAARRPAAARGRAAGDRAGVPRPARRHGRARRRRRRRGRAPAA